MFELIKNVLFAGVGAVYLSKERAEDIVNELIQKGQLSKEEKTQKVKELMEKAEEKVKEFSTVIETQVKKAMDATKSKERKEIEDLKSQIIDIRKEIKGLKK